MLRGEIDCWTGVWGAEFNYDEICCGGGCGVFVAARLFGIPMYKLVPDGLPKFRSR